MNLSNPHYSQPFELENIILYIISMYYICDDNITQLKDYYVPCRTYTFFLNGYAMLWKIVHIVVLCFYY